MPRRHRRESDFRSIPLAAFPVCSPKPTTARSAQIPMPSTIPAIWWGLALLALVAVALVPIGNYFTRRYVAADPWNPT